MNNKIKECEMNKTIAAAIDQLSLNTSDNTLSEFNINLKDSAGKGLGLFATKNFKEGDLIFTEPIFIHKAQDHSFNDCQKAGFKPKKDQLVEKYLETKSAAKIRNVSNLIVLLHDHLFKNLEIPHWVHELASFDHDEWVTKDEKALITKFAELSRIPADDLINLYLKMKTNNFAVQVPNEDGSFPMFASWLGKITSRINTSLTKGGNNCSPSIDVFVNGEWIDTRVASIDNRCTLDFIGKGRCEFRVRVDALTDIASGEELLTQYQDDYVDKIKESIRRAERVKKMPKEDMLGWEAFLANGPQNPRTRPNRNSNRNRKHLKRRSKRKG